MPLIKPPAPDPSLEAFDRGVGVLTRDGDFAGHVATTLGTFWSPSRPLRMQWWVWYIVAWADGTRERSTEDYPPLFLAVNDMKSGHLDVVSEREHRSGRYDFTWLPAGATASVLAGLGITPEDF